MSLSPRITFGDLDLTAYPFSILIDEGDDGVAVNVYQDMISALRDGRIVTSNTTDNREVTRTVMVEGSDLRDVDESAALLARECEKSRNILTLDPGDGYAASAVYETFRAQIVERRSRAMDEAAVRLFDITWPALPFARSVEPFTAAGVTSGAVPTTVTINDATARTGWHQQDRPGGALTDAFDQSGSEVSIGILRGYTSESPALVYRPATPVDMSDTPFLTVRWRFNPEMGVYSYYGSQSRADGTIMPNLGLKQFPESQWNGPFETTYLCSDTSVTEFRLEPPAASTYQGASPSGTFYIDKIVRSNQAPFTGTLRQKSVTIDVPGSARTPASLEVSHATSGLGNVLVYTSPTLSLTSSPALSPYTQSSTADEPAYVSGRRWNAASRTFVVPVSALGRGPHQIVMRADEANWVVSAALLVDGFAVGTTVVGRASSVLLAADSAGMPIYSLGSMTLPPHEVPEGSSATVQISVQRPDLSGSDPRVDEVWAFPMPDDGTAHLSAIAVGTRKRVWLDAPTVDRPNPACYVGNAVDRTDSFGVDGALSNWDEHYFTGGSNQVFVVTSTALDAQVELEGHARWLTHPAA
ncbi:MAG: hypothetical protein CMJ18_07780 [Phycisphaeraceae bacterium]|nr:hypothetical protein [Phycisphaeraceae bacterium]